MPLINFAGLASGIDSNALIQAQSDATRRQRVEPNQKKLTEFEEENTALEELRTKFNTLKTKTKVFSTIAGGGLAKLATSTSETVASASASNSASNGSYTLTVTQRAKNAVVSFDDRFATTTTAIAPAINNADAEALRTVTFTIGTGANQSTVPIVLTSTTTASEFVNQFNTATTAAQAQLVNVGTASSPSYGIVINTTNEGEEKGTLAVSVGASVTGAGAFVTNTTSQALDAEFTVSGISGTITRATNAVSDVIPGLTLNIASTGTTTVTVSDDSTTTQSSVQEFVDSFNDIINYIKENSAISQEANAKGEVANVFGILARTRTDDDSLRSIKDALASTNYSSGTFVKIFADIGITTERDGTLKFDTSKFQEAMTKEPTSVNQVLQTFSDTTTVTGGVIDVVTRFNGSLDITVNSNKSQIDGLNKRISEAEAFIARQEDEMRARFARLESTISKLQSQQSRLTSALAGLSR